MPREHSSEQLFKMATGAEKAYVVLEFHSYQSVTAVQRQFRTKFNKDPPTAKSIRRWYAQFTASGCLCKGKSTGRPKVCEETVERVRESFARSPQKSTNRASRELNIPQPTVWKILRKRLKLKPYRLQLLQALTPNDKVRRCEFSTQLQDLMEQDGFSEKLIFSDEATFFVSGSVNTHNVRIWGSENPHAFVQNIRNCPKVNVFCAVSMFKVYGPFFFCEKSVTGHVYLDMLENFLMPQLETDSVDFIYQQDGAPPHFHLDVRDFLNTRLKNRWIGRGGDDDEKFLSWPPRSPDLTPCDFFVWGYVKDEVFTPPLPTNLPELKARINSVFQQIDRDMLHKVWDELNYRLDVCRITRGAHIEHL